VDDFDLVIVGGGSAGCALAGRLAGRTSLRIRLVEADRTTVPCVISTGWRNCSTRGVLPQRTTGALSSRGLECSAVAPPIIECRRDYPPNVLWLAQATDQQWVMEGLTRLGPLGYLIAAGRLPVIHSTTWESSRACVCRDRSRDRGYLSSRAGIRVCSCRTMTARRRTGACS
jgi:hypothetical protein